MSGQTVIILGAGTGGLVCASRLRRMLGREHRVVLIDRSAHYTFEPSLAWVMTGERTVPRITRDLRTLERRGIEFVAAEVTSIDTTARRVHTANRSLLYDHLIVALGAEYTSEDVPGLNRAWTFYHGDGATGLQEELEKFPGGRVAVCVPSLPYKHPAGPYEGALLLDTLLRKRGVPSEVHVYSPEAAPMEGTGIVTTRIQQIMAERGVGFTGGVGLKSVNHEKKLLNFHQGEPAEFDLLVASPVHQAPPVLAAAGLTGEDGWVAADPEQLTTGVEGVHAIGDCTSVPTPSGGTLPKLAVLAHGQAEVVARNLTAIIGGREPIWAFGGQGAHFIEVGDGRAAYVVANHYADPPTFQFHGPSRIRHWARIGFERLWLWRWF